MNIVQALSMVKRDAEQEKEYAQKAIEFPLSWYNEKHIENFKKKVVDAEIVIHWCFIRQMQINPD